MKRSTPLFAALVAACVLCGCASNRSPYALPPGTDRNPLEAQRLNAQAAAILDELAALDEIPVSAPGHADGRRYAAAQLARTESLLRQALIADLYCGPAHNNLGIVYLSQSSVAEGCGSDASGDGGGGTVTGGKLYEAASEFEWARKLMPGHPDPRMNLALTLERAGKFDDAIATYRTALESNSSHLPSMQALARLQIMHRRTDERTNDYLSEIAIRGDARWSEWARGVLAR